MEKMDFGRKKEFLDPNLDEVLGENGHKELIKSLYFKEHILINKVFLNIL